MRVPTSEDSAYAWHRAAITGECPQIVGSEPQCGWFRRRLTTGGPWVPARIWLHQVTDEHGALAEPEELRCEVDERDRDPFAEWAWLADNPISRQRFEEMIRKKAWAGSNDPTNPILAPEQRVDLGRRPSLPPKPPAGGLFDA